MSDLVGNPEDRFSRDAAHISGSLKESYSKSPQLSDTKNIAVITIKFEKKMAENSELPLLLKHADGMANSADARAV